MLEILYDKLAAVFFGCVFVFLFNFGVLFRYDYVAGHNLNVIQTQSGEEDGPLYDNEQANGTGYYYLPAKPKAKYCNVRKRDGVSQSSVLSNCFLL